jgi:putative peptidoglycan lipid II flippase
MNNAKTEKESKNGAFLVGIGIFLSRIAGLVRQRAFAHYFGNSDAADAFNAAYKIPNFLQNLFGEGVLSASFIPVYANLLASKDESGKTEASKVASTIFSLLFLMTSIFVIIGVFLTPFLIDTIAPGFHGEKRELTIKLVQIIFPGTGLLVLCAWCLGILNSHRQFFLSYAAPVIWNFTIIAVLIIYGRKYPQFELAKVLSYGLVLGSFLQFLVQFPSALKLIPLFKIELDIKSTHIKTIIKNFFPVVFSRGVVQLSAYIDSMLASLLPTGAVSALAYAQLLYLLPVSLFGMSITAAELPAMSSLTGSKEEVYEQLKKRLGLGLNRIAFFIVPSVCAFLFLGDVIISAVFQSGKFDSHSTQYVWGVLAGSTIGLLASTLGRLYSSTFYSLKDTRTPLNFAIIRVILTTVLGYLFAFPLPQLLGLKAEYGCAGLTASAGISGWIEFYLLRKSLNKRIGNTGLTKKYQMMLWSAGIISAVVAFLINRILPLGHIIKAVIVVGFYGSFYFFITYKLGISESKNTIDKILKKIRRK